MIKIYGTIIKDSSLMSGYRRITIDINACDVPKYFQHIGITGENGIPVWLCPYEGSSEIEFAGAETGATKETKGGDAEFLSHDTTTL